MEALAAVLISHLKQTEAFSALPDAPVVEDRPRRGAVTARRVRAGVARSLRAAASRVEPAAFPAPLPRS